jgi:hypothetical protein
MGVPARRFAAWVDNAGYEVSLERNKIYVIVPDAAAQRDGDLRVVDAADRFVAIEVPTAVRASLLKAS